MSKLSPEAQAIVNAGREALSPSPASKEQVLSAVQASIANPSAGGSALAQSGGSAGSTKLLLALALVAGIGGGLWLYGGNPGGKQEQAISNEEALVERVTPKLPAAPATMVEAEKADEPPGVEETIADVEPAAEPDPHPEKKRKAKRKTQAASSAASTLLAERKLIGAAQIAIRNQDYSRARSLLRQHKNQFPQGILAPERDAARAIALCLNQDEDAGTAAGRAFLKAHKNSPLAQRVKSVCGLR